MPDSPIFFVIQRIVSCVYFDARRGAWSRDIEAVKHYASREFAVAVAREWCLEDEVEVTGHRIVKQPRPERMDGYSPEGPDS